MYIFFSILIVIASLLLMGVILIQKSKGGGLASDYASGNQYLGYRKTTDFIEKLTWGLAIFICVLSICSAFTVKTPMTSSQIQQAVPTPNAAAPAPAAKPAAKPAAVPAAPAAPAQAPAETPAK